MDSTIEGGEAPDAALAKQHDRVAAGIAGVDSHRFGDSLHPLGRERIAFNDEIRCSPLAICFTANGAGPAAGTAPPPTPTETASKRAMNRRRRSMSMDFR